MGNNRNNRGNQFNPQNRQQPAAATPTPPVAETTEPTAPETDTAVLADGTNGTEQTQNTSNDTTEQSSSSAEGEDTSSNPNADDTVDNADDIVTSEDEADTAEEPADDTSERVADLKVMLADFAEANSVIGSKPADYTDAAKKLAAITRFVIRHPKQDVFMTLLGFFRDEAEGVCKAENFLKGTSTLSNLDERRVGVLYTLFSNIATGQIQKVESSTIITVLEKQEIVSFYNRQQAVLKQNR